MQSQPTGSPTPIKQAVFRSVLSLALNGAPARNRKLRELQGLEGLLSEGARLALEITIQALLEAGGLDVDSVTITDISDNGSGVLDITYKAILNVSPDTTEQEAQEQARTQLEESLDEDVCGDNCFSTELQTSLSEVNFDGDDCGDVTCEELLNADVEVSTVSVCLLSLHIVGSLYVSYTDIDLPISLSLSLRALHLCLRLHQR